MNKSNFWAIVMPTKACNLACEYCYVTDKPTEMMSHALVERVLDQLLQHNDPEKLTRITWHGGEPMLAGIDFYQHVCSVIREQYPGHNIQHAIQTNGTLLTDEWIDFFLTESFDVGVSLDGPKELHDSCRKSRDGKGTFDHVFGNILHARERGLIVGVLCVVTRHTVGYEDNLFDFFYRNKLDFSFHPITAVNDGMADDLSITPQEFARISIRLFDLGFYQPEPRVTTASPSLHYATAVMMGQSSGFCVFSESCAEEYISVGPEGQVHVCDRFADYPELSYGNIIESSLEEILDSPVRKEFLKPRAALLSECQQCEWGVLCQAGCPHETYARTGSVFERDPFCEGYQMIFRHVYDVISRELEKASGKLPVQSEVSEQLAYTR